MNKMLILGVMAFTFILMSVNANAWIGVYNYRQCATITNPHIELNNYTFKINLNLSSGVDIFGGDTIEYNTFNHSDIDTTGAANNTIEVNVPTITTDNNTLICRYFNDYNALTYAGGSIGAAGIFGDDFSTDKAGWTGGTQIANDWYSRPQISGGFAYSDSDGGESMNYVLSDTDFSIGYRTIARSSVASTGYVRVDMASTTASAGYGHGAPRPGNNDWEIIRLANNSTAATPADGNDNTGGNLDWATGTLYITENAHDSLNGYFTAWVNDDKWAWTVANNSDATHDTFSRIGLAMRKTNDKYDYILVTKWCRECSLTWGDVESIPLDMITTSPTNTTYDNNTLYLSWSNLTFAYDSALYELNGVNTTITGNVTYNVSPGSKGITVYANDSTGKWYSASVSYNINWPVTVNITTPNNNTIYAPPNINLTWDYSSFGSCNYSVYSIDDGTNITTNCNNITIAYNTSGEHNITLYANNSYGYSDSQTVFFNITNVLVNCSDQGAIEAVKFEFYDEDTLEALNGSAEFAVTASDGSYSFTYNLSVVNVSSFSICIGESPQTVDMIMLYRAEGYQQRTYYFNNAELTNTLQTIGLYQITNTLGEKVSINTRDSNDNDVEDVYVDIERYYPETDSYRTIAIGKSDNIGIILTYLDLDDVFYKFTLLQDSEAVNTYSAMTITDTTDDPETMVLYIGALDTQFFEMINNIGITCYFNTTTNNTVCSITDPSGLIVTAELVVKKTTLSGMTEICSDSGSGAAFTLSCNIPSVTGEYHYFVKVTPSPNPPYVLYSDTFFQQTPNEYGISGLFVALLFTLAVAGIGFYTHEIIGIGIGVTWGVLAMSGLISLPGVAIVSVVIMGVMLMIGVNKRG